MLTKMTSDDKQIEAVRQQETRRSKRPIDIEARRREMVLRKKFIEAIESEDFEAFQEALIRDLGQTPGTPEYQESIQAWRDYHGGAS